MRSRIALDVARGSGYLVANSIMTMVVSIGAFAVIARLISREEMGVVAVLSLVVAATQLLAGMGVAGAATKFVASFDETEQHQEVRRVGYGCLLISAVVTLVLVFASYLSAGVLAEFLFGDVSRSNLLRLLALEIAATGVANPLVGVLSALKRFREISVISIVTFAVRQTLVIVFLELGLGLSGMMIGWGIGDSLNSLALFYYVRKLVGPFPTRGLALGSVLRFSGPLFLGEVTAFLRTWFDRVLLLPLVPLAQLGAYNVAVTAFGLLNSMPLAISATLFPFYSRFYPNSKEALSQTEDLENAIRRASRYVAFFTIPLSIGMAAVAMPAATLLAGNNYADAAYPLAVLSISLAAGCLVMALSQTFVVLGKTKTSAGITVVSVLTSVLVGVLLIPHLGILAASLARGASPLMVLLFSTLVLRRTLRLRFDMNAYYSAWIASLFMAGALLLVQKLFYSKYMLPFYVVFGGLVFFLVLRLLRAINDEDVELVLEFLGTKFRFLARVVKIFHS